MQDHVLELIERREIIIVSKKFRYLFGLLPINTFFYLVKFKKFIVTRHDFDQSSQFIDINNW